MRLTGERNDLRMKIDSLFEGDEAKFLIFVHKVNIREDASVDNGRLILGPWTTTPLNYIVAVGGVGRGVDPILAGGELPGDLDGWYAGLHGPGGTGPQGAAFTF